MRTIKEYIHELTKPTERPMPKWDVENEGRITKAFECDGKQFYQFEDINSMMTGRAFTCIDYYQELSMRCTREYLEKHCEKMDELLSGTEINIMDIAQIESQLKERLTMIVDPDVIYKIASVVYFDENESPWSYDFKYNQRKISHWKSLNLDDFFFMIRVKDLIPLGDLSNQDLATYIQVGNRVNKAHLGNLSTMN